MYRHLRRIAPYVSTKPTPPGFDPRNAGKKYSLVPRTKPKNVLKRTASAHGTGLRQIALFLWKSEGISKSSWILTNIHSEVSRRRDHSTSIASCNRQRRVSVVPGRKNLRTNARLMHVKCAKDAVDRASRTSHRSRSSYEDVRRVLILAGPPRPRIG